MDPQTLEADFPALPPPPGQTPNFDNPSSKVGVFTTLSATFAAVAFCFVSLRTFSRLWVSRTFSRDDCKILGISIGTMTEPRTDASVVALVQKVTQ